MKDNYIGHFNNVKMVAAPLMIHLLANVAKRTQKFDKYNINDNDKYFETIQLL